MRLCIKSLLINLLFFSCVGGEGIESHEEVNATTEW